MAPPEEGDKKKRKAHVGSWKPGQSGNPNGRPKSKILHLLGKLAGEKRAGRFLTREQELATSMWADALDKVPGARTVLLERMLGKVPLPIEGGDGESGKVLNINIISYADGK